MVSVVNLITVAGTLVNTSVLVVIEAHVCSLDPNIRRGAFWTCSFKTG